MTVSGSPEKPSLASTPAGDAEPAVTVYTVPRCLDCAAVKNLLAEAGVPFREVDISRIPHARQALQLLSGIETMPQVFIGSRFIGQVAEIRYLVRTGKLHGIIADVRKQTGNKRPSR